VNIFMEIDHIVPEAVGGMTVSENLCLACISCNTYKRDYQTGIDPETHQEVALFNPRIQHWQTHFAWSAGGTRLVGRTPVGRATIERLKINRELVVVARQRWIQAGWHPSEEDE
jgi:hypothetical protein